MMVSLSAPPSVVVAGLPFDSVVPVAAEDDVVAARHVRKRAEAHFAVEEVVASAAEDDVVSADDHVVVGGVSVVDVACHIVAAVAAVDLVVAAGDGKAAGGDGAFNVKLSPPMSPASSAEMTSLPPFIFAAVIGGGEAE